MEGLGFSKNEILKQLTSKYGISDRMLYYDYQRRKSWQPLIQELADPQKLILKIINRFEQIYQRAAFIHLSADNDNARIGALRTMIEANSKLAETVVLRDIAKDLAEIKAHLRIE